MLIDKLSDTPNCNRLFCPACSLHNSQSKMPISLFHMIDNYTIVTFLFLFFLFFRGLCFCRSILLLLLLGVVPCRFLPVLFYSIYLPVRAAAAPPFLCLGIRGRSAHACPLNYSTLTATCQPNNNHLYHIRENLLLLRVYTGERT